MYLKPSRSIVMFILVIIWIIAQRYYHEEKISRDMREAMRRDVMLYEGLEYNSTVEKFWNHASMANSLAEQIEHR